MRKSTGTLALWEHLASLINEVLSSGRSWGTFAQSQKLFCAFLIAGGGEHDAVICCDFRLPQLLRFQCGENL